MSVSEVARTLGVDRDQVKSWAFLFKDYLSYDANPPKQQTRYFTAEDLQVLAYVSCNWEDETSFDDIETGLYSGEHHNEQYSDVLVSAVPIFQEPPEDIDETWRHGSLVGGIVNLAFDRFTLADSYKLAGDTLVDAALSNFDADELIYPIVYNYRHAIELYLKAVLTSTSREHDLQQLLQKLRVFLQCEQQTTIPSWFERVIAAFGEFDPNSTTFRYGGSDVYSRLTGDSGEFWIDIRHLKKLMGWLAKSFTQIRNVTSKARWDSLVI